MRVDGDSLRDVYYYHNPLSKERYIVTVTALLENTVSCPAVQAEHGLSLVIETAGHTVLFDAGQTDLFAKNALTIGVDLADIDIAVLSHGHYDHGGGMTTFLAINDHAPLYLSRYAFEPHYNGREKYIGLSPVLMDSDRLRFADDVTVIAEGMTLYSMNGRERCHDLGSFGLTVAENGQFRDDDFRHEQYLLIEEHGKRVLISGCSHKGIVDIAEWFKPDVLIGGFHLSKITDTAVLDRIADTLNQFDTTYYTCHCTGEQVYTYLRERMPRLQYLSCGDRITL